MAIRYVDIGPEDGKPPKAQKPDVKSPAKPSAPTAEDAPAPAAEKPKRRKRPA